MISWMLELDIWTSEYNLVKNGQLLMEDSSLKLFNKKLALSKNGSKKNKSEFVILQFQQEPESQ